jgi:predicted ATPase
MKLTNLQRKKLHEALLDAFPTQAALAKLLSFELDVNLAAVAGGGALDAVVLALIEWAESQGRTEELIQAARATAPLNNLLQQVNQDILAQTEADQHSLSLQTLLQWLPVANEKLFGREEELRWLDDCFKNPALGILVLTGFGGVGKTALVRHWLTTRFSSGTEAPSQVIFIGCSFFSQGTRERAGTSDQFLYESLRSLGDPDPTKGSAWIRAKRLASYAAREPTILVLDGLEPLQYGPGQRDLEGRLKDAGIREFLSNLASHRGQAFCLVTSRLTINEPFLAGPACIQKPLDRLSSGAAERILRYRGLRGTARDFQRAVEYLARHPLALTLAAEYLNTFEESEVGRIDTIPLINEETRAGRHAKSVMAAYEIAFAREGNLLDAELLRILGLFDRPIRRPWMEALCSGPRIPGFARFGATDPQELKESIDRLRRWGLLSEVAEDGSIDTHPLIREYYGSKLRTENAPGWKAANEILYRYYCGATTELPASVEEMEPLLLAVVHGCRAGNYAKVLHEVYIKRIMRGDMAYAATTLNLIGPLLAVLTQFFEKKSWPQPIAVSPLNPQGLDLGSQVYILNQLGYFTTAARGYASSEVDDIYEQAQQRCLALGDRQTLFKIKYGIWRYYSAKGDLAESLSEGEELLALAQDLAGEEHTVAAHRALATSLYRLARFRESLEHARSGAAICLPAEYPAHLQAHFGDDPSTNCRCFAAMSLWHLGSLEQARCLQFQALERVRQDTNAHSRAVGLYLGSYLYDFNQEYENAQAAAEEMIDLSSEHGFKWWLAAGLIRRGWAVSMLGDAEEGLAALKEGLGIWRSTGSGIGLPYWNSLLAEVLIKGGRHAEAIGLLDQAILLLNKSNERWWEPEVYRLKGQALLELAISEEEAEDCFNSAIEISRRRCDRSLELRAVKPLGQYLYNLGRAGDACALIRTALAGFSEGLETKEIREAEGLVRFFSS